MCQALGNRRPAGFRITAESATSQPHHKEIADPLISGSDQSRTTATSQPNHSHIIATSQSQPNHSHITPETEPLRSRRSTCFKLCEIADLLVSISEKSRRKLFLKQFRKKYTLELRLRSQRVWSRPEQVSSVLATILLQAIDDFTSQSDTSQTSRSLPPATKVNCVLAARRSIDLTHLRSACAQALRNRPVRLCQAVRNRRSAYFRVAAESQSNHSHITPESQLSHLPNHSHITGSQPSHGHMTAESQPQDS